MCTPLYPEKRKNRLLCLLTVLLTGCLLTLVGCRTDSPPPAQSSGTGGSPAAVTPSGAKTVIKLSFTGDIMIHSDQLYSAFDRRTGDYSFAGVFDDVKPYLATADLTIGNLETTVAGRAGGYTGYPRFNTPRELLPALREAGFDVLTTANNHALDRGAHGVLKTIAHLDTAGLMHTGTAVSAEARSRPLTVNVNGVRVAILAYTYGTNGLTVPKGKSYLVNILNPELVREDIGKARAAGADVVVVSPHFGVEYRRYPGAGEKQLVEELFQAGADIVIGSHPHVLQPMVRRDPGGRQAGLFVAYSMGNFISSQQGRYRDSSVILNLILEKDGRSGKISLVRAECIPVWVDRYRQNGRTKFRVVAVEKAIRDFAQGLDPRLTAEDYARLKQVWQEVAGVLAVPFSPSPLRV